MKGTGALEVKDVSKLYRLGQIGTGTLSHDLNRWWHNLRGKEDPYLKIGEENDRASTQSADFVYALKDINFSVSPGEVLGIIGKNGAGKSTLLKIISKITSPSSGSIIANGRMASLLEVGTGMHPEMTARENVYLNGAILGMSRTEVKSKFDDIIDFAGCSLYVDTPVKRFSSGMRVRIGFAVAAFLEPEILIVDEVLAVGDAEFQKQAIGKMKDVSAKSGRTVLFVSHNMTAVESLCHNVLVLDKGKVAIEKEKPSIAIPKYLSSGLKNLALREWNEETAPQSDEVMILKASLNKSIPQFFVDEPIEIAFDFVVKENFEANLSLVLWRNGGEMVFNAVSEIKQVDHAKYSSVCCIPANLLNDGEYQVDIAIVKDTSVKVLTVPEVLGFTIEDKREKMNWHGKWEGVVRPKLEFNLNKHG